MKPVIALAIGSFLTADIVAVGMSGHGLGFGGATVETTAASTAADRPRAHLAPELFAAWAKAFLDKDGRVVDTGNSGISHTEGQGYGLLLAAFAGDRPAFERMLGWTVSHLGTRDDALFSWIYDPGSNPPVRDRNNATDGDMLIAWALAEAGDRWNEPRYRLTAGMIARAIASKVTVSSPFGRVLLPGAAGFSATERADGPVVNLSYWVYPALPSLGDVAPEYDWKAIADSGVKIGRAARFGPRALPSDWIEIGSGKAAPASGFAPEFSYNAIRIPLYVAWAGVGDRGDLAPYAAAWDHRAPEITSFDKTAATRPFGEDYGGVPALVACALDGKKLPATLKTETMSLYYPSTLRLLVLSAASERYPQCL